ncbi:MAG: hypothetical protein GX590_10635, partial [Lentisphaerae bacterium]|nr:hypothetical protein [Lentisphaerota bacterium]
MAVVSGKGDLYERRRGAGHGGRGGGPGTYGDAGGGLVYGNTNAPTLP